jgi:SAM-dependent methyltransferase
VNVIWHDLECGAYAADMDVWRALAERHGDPLLEVGAGTGRIALDLARRGHIVTALDQDPVLIAELARRADGVELSTVLADARDFELARRFALIIVPMQTIQLLGGRDGRGRFLQHARRHLDGGGTVAVAITETLELYSAREGFPVPIPDIRELDGVLYSSQPTAVREDADGFVLERLRETITPEGARTTEDDLIRLDRVTADELELEGRDAELLPAGRIEIAPTPDHVGSVVVMMHA